MKCISFTTSKETSVHIFLATRLLLLLKEAEWSDLQKSQTFFLIFDIDFLTHDDSKTKKIKKNSLYFLIANDSPSFDMNITL